MTGSNSVSIRLFLTEIVRCSVPTPKEFWHLDLSDSSDWCWWKLTTHIADKRAEKSGEDEEARNASSMALMKLKRARKASKRKVTKIDTVLSAFRKQLPRWMFTRSSWEKSFARCEF